MFDEKKARRVIRFIECLKHTKGEFHGKPFKLLPWQEKIIRDVFGTVREGSTLHAAVQSGVYRDRQEETENPNWARRWH